MEQFDQAKQLIEHCRQLLKDIERYYSESLSEKQIQSSLQITIKTYLEHLRSALEYSAYGLFLKYGNPDKNKDKIYFPYARQGLDLMGFRQNKIIERGIPGLSLTRPDIEVKIETYQHFSNSGYAWLPVFMEMTNDNKHKGLSPQVRYEENYYNMQIGKVTWRFGEKASLKVYGDIIIDGEKMPGRTISAKNPLVHRKVKNEFVRWISFNFSSNNEPVLPLLSQAYEGVDKIVNELSIL